MRSRINAPRLAVALVFALLAGCATASLGRDDVSQPLQLEADQIVVGIDLVTAELRVDLAKQLARYYDLEIAGAFPLDSIDLHCIVYRVRRGHDIDALMERLRRHPGVRLVQRNQRFTGLENAGAADPYASLQYGPARIRAQAAHRWVTGRGVRVAVIDTGVDVEHPDLVTRDLTIRNFVDGGRRVFERDRHGTAVAGIIVAQTNNGEGIAGVAPDAEILASKACWHPDDASEAAYCSSWTIARALDHALGRDVRIVNLSLGGPPDELIERLLVKAHERGVLIVAAAGEERDALRFPASLDFVVAAVASDVDGLVPSEPAQSKPWLVAAPGLEVLTTAPGGRYLARSGSSLATAHIAGAAALLLEFAPELRPDELARALLPMAGDGRDPRHEGRGAARSPLQHLDVCDALFRLSEGAVCAAHGAESGASTQSDSSNISQTRRRSSGARLERPRNQATFAIADSDGVSARLR